MALKPKCKGIISKQENGFPSPLIVQIYKQSSYN
jgi:hypothetical protein